MIPPPQKMEVEGDIVGNWEFFKDSWENYAVATELSKKSAEIQVATLMTIMGKDCHKICKNIPMTDAERKDPQIILKKLTEYFQPARNTTYERYVFNSCVQGNGETFDSFLGKLRQLSRTCEYGQLTDELLKDRIVIGIMDNNLRARLLREEDLTLDKAVNLCRSSEITNTHMQNMQGIEQVNLVSKSRKSSKLIKNCDYCGETHPKRKCPAFGKRCTSCNAWNHFAEVCRTTKYENSQRTTSHSNPRRNKNAYMVGATDDEDDIDSEVDSTYVVSNGKGKKAYFVDVDVHSPDEGRKISMKFQLDSGSTTSTMRLEDYKKITKIPPEKTTKKLRTYNNKLLTPVGHARLKCTTNNITKYLHVDVVKDVPVSLLSGRACETFQLLEFNELVYKLSETNLSKEDVMKDKSEPLVFRLREEIAEDAEIEKLQTDVFVSDQRLEQIKDLTFSDPTILILANTVMKGWPTDKKDVPLCIQDYWPYRDEISTQNGLVYRGTRLIIPNAMRAEMLERAHASHL